MITLDARVSKKMILTDLNDNKSSNNSKRTSRGVSVKGKNRAK
jgi:hypothetical protein